MQKTVIKATDVDFWYGSTQALLHVSIDVPIHSITALIGPSGCGKSTFLRTLNRMNDLIPAARLEGIIEYQGKNIYAKDVDVIDLRKKIGMVFQKPNPFPMSVYDNIAYGPRIHGIKRRAELDTIVERTLKQVGLYDEVSGRLHRSAMALSGGQQQRLCIARVLAVEPDVILMDEPTSALDPVSVARIEDLLALLKEQYSIIIVTHNMQQASRISDTTGFFLEGALVEYGKTKDIFLQPKDVRTERYISGHFG